MAQAISNLLSPTNANSTSPYAKAPVSLPKKTTPSNQVVFGVPQAQTKAPSPALVALSKQYAQPKQNQTQAPQTTPVQSSYTPPAPQNTPAQAVNPNQGKIDQLNQQLGIARNELTRVQQQGTQGATPTTPVKGLFSDVVSSLAGRGTAGGPQYQNAQDAYEKAVNDLTAFKTSVADKTADIYSDPVSARVMQGRDAAVQQANAEKLAALQGAVQQQQTGIGLEQTQQQLEQQALQQAGQLASPVQIAPGSTLASPVGGETIAGGLGGYVNYQTAEQVMGLISQYPDAGYSYNQNMTPQQNLMMAQQAIQASPTYQKSTFGVPGQGSIAGATGVQTAQSGYSSAYQTYNQMVGQKSNADALANNVVSVMDQYGISPTDVRKVNQVYNDIKRRFGDEGQAAFDTAIKEAQAAYSNLLSVGGGTIPTEATAASQTLLNPDATVAQVIASINELKKAAEFKMNAQGQQVNTYWSQLQSAGGQQQSGGGGNSGNPFEEEWL